ncbi:MAG: chitobiase/beta-hexosaminidase C-terminal domain-containing protein [Candidatus Limivicinus sp.]
MAIHFPEKYKQALMKGFAEKSETDSMFSHEMDTEFTGVNTVHVTSLKTEPMQDYNKSKAVGTGSRYGDTKEVGDEVQTFTVTQDKSLSLSIDKGNNVNQFNMKKAGEVMKAHRDEQIIPEVDKYRLEKWAKDAGIHKELDAAPTKTNIVSQIIELHNEMLNEGVPDQITLTIARKYLPALKLSTEWVGLDSLGGKTLPKGSLGEFDGMAVKPMSDKKMPANVPFMLTYKGSIISPCKINTFKGHVDPPGLSGDLLEFRMMYDAFVLGKKAKGVAVACLPGTVVKTPTISVTTGKATIASATSGATIYYTTDGSDPRYSVDVKTYTAAVTLADGDQLRAYAAMDGMFNSAVAEYDYKA